MSQIKFGWIAPVIGIAETDNVPLVMTQQAEILPVVAEHFDSLWVFDHFYGFGDREASYLENWTTLTWLAAHFPALKVGSIVLGVGYRNREGRSTRPTAIPSPKPRCESNSWRRQSRSSA
jgi:hypothetical protein